MQPIRECESVEEEDSVLHDHLRSNSVIGFVSDGVVLRDPSELRPRNRELFPASEFSSRVTNPIDVAGGCHITPQNITFPSISSSLLSSVTRGCSVLPSSDPLNHSSTPAALTSDQTAARLARNYKDHQRYACMSSERKEALLSKRRSQSTSRRYLEQTSVSVGAVCLSSCVQTTATSSCLLNKGASASFPRFENDDLPVSSSHCSSSSAEEKIEKFTVEVHAKVTNCEQKFYYMACQKCYSATDAASDYYYMCVMCGENTQAKPRERIHLNIYDATGSLDVTAFGSPAIYIMQMDSTMCLQLLDGGEPVTANWINQKLSDKTYFMNIRRKENQVGGTLRQQYTILNVQLKQTDIDTGTSTSQITDEAGTSKDCTHFKHSVVKELFPETKKTDSKDEDAPSLFDSSVLEEYQKAALMHL